MVSDLRLLRWMMVGALAGASGCSTDRRFPLRAPLLFDTDEQPVYTACHEEASEKTPHHRVCTPEPYDATIYWDGADQLVFRPLSQSVGIVRSGESVDVNALDEVPDSSWFTNRLGVRPVSLDELRMNACAKDVLLDPDHAPDGAWVITKGKSKGSTPGFQMQVPGKGKYLVKVEAAGLPERQVAASVIGEAVFYAAGYNASCEQALFVRPSIFKLTPGLTARHGNFGDDYPFDEKALRDLFDKSHKVNGLLRISASAWIPGHGLGQFRYEGTRGDDPNDVIPHQNRRELRGARLLAAWIDHFDSREGNSLDTWIPQVKGAKDDSSPGHVVHYQIGTSAALGSAWDWDPIARRLGYSYILDWSDFGEDFLTLGAVTHPWDVVRKTPGQEIFGYMDVAHFDPEKWKNEYSNPAFSRMTERDGAWMARILARFTPQMVKTLTEMARLSDPSNTTYLEGVLDGRLDKILRRYLLRLSPIDSLHVEGTDRLCGVDVADWRGLAPASAFRYGARFRRGPWLPPVERAPGGRVCVTLPHVVSDAGPPDDSAQRYVRVVIRDGVAEGRLVAHLYDLGPVRGYRLVGLERPEP